MARHNTAVSNGTEAVKTRYTIQVLSVDSSDSKPALLVTFPDKRYLFNTPESIGRICVQNKTGLKKVGQAFVGDLQASTGLPGFILSAVEAGAHKLQVYGPRGLKHYLASCRYFTRRDQLSLEANEVAPSLSESSAPSFEQVFSDSNLSVHALSLTASPSSKPSLKRRRSQTSLSPSPEPRTGQLPVSRLDVSSPSFRPASLRGDAAAEWRAHVLNDMFRGKAFGTLEFPAKSLPEHGSHLFAKSMVHRGRTPAYLPQPLPPAFDEPVDRVAASYLVVGPAIRGKFQPQKAMDRGVKPGAAFKRLIAGERVWVPKDNGKETQVKGSTKETKKERSERMKREREAEASGSNTDGVGEGHWVEPADCLEQGEDASAFVTLNIPSPDYLDSLCRLQPEKITKAANGSSIRAFYYFLGPNVLQDARLHDYMRLLDCALPHPLEHRISSSDMADLNGVTFVHSALLTLRLGLLAPDVFTLPVYSPPGSIESPLTKFEAFLPPTARLLSTNERFSQVHQPVRPEPGVEYRHFDFDVPSAEANEEMAKLKIGSVTKETQKLASDAWRKYVEAADQIKREIENIESEQALVSDGLQVTPLGTGSAIPSKYRNVSSTLIHMPQDDGSDERAYMLFDAGEGTWGQITRRFGIEDAQTVLAGIKVISISHLHQDHHAGLTTIMRERSLLSPPPKDPLVIIGPPGVRAYLHEQQELFDLGLDRNSEPGQVVKFIDCSAIEFDGASLQADSWKQGGRHERVEDSAGWKVSFSGDTMPCEALVKAGRGSTLLIHEATIQDDMPEVAYAKGHSTFGQAIDIAKRMGAQYLLLTHFSARYPKLPPLIQEPVNPPTNGVLGQTERKDPVVAIAFDMATLKLTDFWKTSRWSKAMDILFSWDEVDEDKETNVLSVSTETNDVEEGVDMK
ncbi:hypothetical protein OIV83_005002 [Microbotryomycetes sp. JL201]|nr:hypothetical protein OIV83_005002 [Microbotryomycetes sp. JL201]